MKKSLLLLLVLSLGLTGWTQKGVQFKKELVNKAVTKSRVINKINNTNYVVPERPRAGSQPVAKGESVIGNTFYDLQSNAVLSNRIWLYDDGTAGAVWTRGVDSPPSFPDRGAGYNYFDGTSWGPQPTSRIESVRAGWPSYAAWGENGEIVVSHDFSAGSLILNTRPEKGTGDWTESFLEGPDSYNISWPRMVTSGGNHDIIQMLCTTPADPAFTNGQAGALMYSRTTDGGQTWDPELTILEGTGIDYYNGITADDYAWAEPRGDEIAFVCISAWYDLFVMKSFDNGETWEKILVWEHPYPFFDWNTTITTDTIWAPDNSGDIAIGEDGKVHVVFGLTRVAHTEVGGSYSYWPWTDGIVYWNEDMSPFTATNQHKALAYENLVENETLIGWVAEGDLMEELHSYRELGMSTIANITADNGQVVVVWSSVTPGYDNQVFNFRHIWTRRSYDNGNPNSWGEFKDLDTDILHWLDECIYPVMAGSFDDADNAFLMYQADATPGTALDGDHDYQENSMYAMDYIPVGIQEDEFITDENVSQNYPNPFNNTSVVNVTLSESANLSLEITNLIGQVVYEIKMGEVNAGAHSFTIDASGLNSGVYFYTVRAGESAVTKKMIVE
jgi:hypothetical protein